MTYATQQDLIDRFGERELVELTDRADPPAGVIDAAVVAAALADADEIVNSYVGKRYDLPLASVPAVLTRVAGDIARHLLHKDAPSEAVQKARDEALRFLRDVSKGEAVLDSGGDEPAPAEASVQVESQDKLFGRDDLTGF